MSIDSKYWKEKGVFFLLFDEEKTSGEEIPKISAKEIKIVELIGSGAFAEVYRAQWNGMDVAAKKLKSKENVDVESNFVKEVKLIARLKHPNILNFFGICTETNSVSIITEFMEKGSLCDVLHKGQDSKQLKKSMKLKLQIMVDITKGMNFLHSLDPPIIHRDLKSHNILLNNKWCAKIADFGISRAKDRTESMTTIGTPQWMAPEVLIGERYNEKVDIYSFGVIMWELCSHKKPWDGVNPMAVVRKIAYEGENLAIPQDCPPSVSSIMEKCWESASNRPSFGALMEELMDVENKFSQLNQLGL